MATKTRTTMEEDYEADQRLVRDLREASNVLREIADTHGLRTTHPRVGALTEDLIVEYQAIMAQSVRRWD